MTGTASASTTTVRSACPYCGVGCGIVMEVSGNRVVKLSGDRAHPSNAGRLCTKGNTAALALTATGRMEKAHVRHAPGQEQVPMAMDAAISETAARLRCIRDEHGPDAISFYVSGQMSLEAQYLANKLAKGYIRTKHIESNSRLCMASAGSGYKLSLGSDGPPGSYEDFDRTDLFLVTGANMADCHPILFLRMMDRVKQGARLIVVDPRRNATADKADLFLQIRPGTDLALLNGLLYLLVVNGHTDPAFIDAFTEGWETMPDFLAEYTPEKVAAITGLAEADIRKAAAWIGEAPEFMTCWTMGLNQSTHGTWNTNAICNLHLATGKICRPGSGPFSLTGQPNAMGGREMGYMGPGLPGQRSALVAEDRRFIEQMWNLPTGALRAEAGSGTVAMFEEMKAGSIKACWIICTNPVASVANRQTVIDGLKAAGLVITQDAFLDTETNIYADIMLPGALWAEADGVMVNSERNMTLTAKAVEPPGEALPDWQIIARIACEMGYADGFSFASAAEVFDEIRAAWNPKTGYDIRGASHERLRQSPLQWPIASGGAARNPQRYINNGVSQKKRERRDGVVPALVFATDSGRAVFLPRPHMMPAEMPGRNFPFVLNTGRLQHQWHTLTKTGKIATLNRLNPGPFIEINPEDAAEIGINDKDRVEVSSVRGKAILPAIVTDRVLPGNCFAPFHWNDVFGDDLAINAVTSDAIDPLSWQPEFKFSAVALARVAAAPVEPKQALPSTGDTAVMNANVSPFAPQPVSALGATPEIAALAAFTGVAPQVSLQLDEHERNYVQGYLAGLGATLETCREATPVIPASAPLDPARRLMINGMLAGLFSRDTTAPAMPVPAVRSVTVLWASQTGNSEAAAVRCGMSLTAEGCRVRVVAMDEITPADLARTSVALFFASTFGDGDPPDNGAAFWQALQAAAMPALDGLEYGVIGFGDSNYDQFCGFARALDARLEALGARRLLERADCEPDTEDLADMWTRSALEKIVNGARAAADPVPVAAPVIAAAPAPLSAAFSRKNPRPSRFVLNRVLNAEGSSKEVRQLAFETGNGALEYQAGDALGVWPRNCPELVGEILKGLSLGPDTAVSVDGGQMPLAQALEQCFEIARPSTDFLRWWATRAADEELAARLAGEDRAALSGWLWGRQIADIVAENPVAVTADELLANLKRLQPRLYSISSSPKATPGEVHLTVSTVRYDCSGRGRKGVASTYLADRAGSGEIGLFVQTAAHFRPPRDADAPMIMVGPGTGVAPFRAFLQERQATGAVGRNWLFFGEQRRQHDFYYRDELETWQKSGHLTRFDHAFSRDQQEKIYVQNRMLEQGAELWRWLEEGAHFYVCGDASRMAKDVDAALREVVERHGGLAGDRASEYVLKMSADKRYVKDVY